MSEPISREEWIAFMATIDPEANVDQLINAQVKADSFFAGLSEKIEHEISESLEINFEPGYKVGNYQLIRQVGKGGMAHVYLASRADNLFEHQVAIKLLPPHQLTEKVIAHFNKERELLASLNHPNIAKIFDGGVTKDGIPYLVMEYIDGAPIDVYCRANALKSNQKIGLVVKILNAIQHAHNRFILHRDLKPSNILITPDGEPMLVDFGIGQSLSDEMISTESGTLKYLPPEVIQKQAATTQSDLYQMGLVLYELLNDQSPFDDIPREEIHRTIMDWGYVSPKNISHRLSEVLQQSLQPLIENRYLSASEFAQDLLNYLQLQPTRASHSTILETTLLYLRRNKLAAGLTLVIVAISLGSAITNQIQIEKTLKEKAKLEESNKFLKSIFSAIDPNQNNGEEIKAKDLLKNTESSISQIENDEIKAYSLAQLGMLYAELGLWKESGPIFDQAIKLYEGVIDPDPIELANAQNNYAGYFRNTSQLKKADSVINIAIDILEVVSIQYPIALAESYREKGYIQYMLGQYEEGEEWTMKAINLLSDATKNNIDPNQEYTKGTQLTLAAAYNTLSSNLREQSKLEEALAAAEKAKDIGEPMKLEEYSPYGLSLTNLALVHNRLGNYEQQLNYLTINLEEELSRFSVDNPRVLNTLANLGSAYYKLEQYDKSDSLTLIAYDTYLSKFGQNHQYTLSTLYNLGNSKYDQEKFQEANEYYLKVLEGDLVNLGNVHPYVAGDYVSLGNVQFHQRQWSEAEKYYWKAFDIYSKNFGEEHQKISYSHWLLGKLYWEINDLKKAEFHYNLSVVISKKVLGADHRLHQKYRSEYDSLFTKNN